MLLEIVAKCYDDKRTHQLDTGLYKRKFQLQIEGNLFVFLVVICYDSNV